MWLTVFTADGLEELYEEAHAKIREDPNLPGPKDTKGAAYWKAQSTKYHAKKLTHAQRRANIAKKIKELTA